MALTARCPAKLAGSRAKTFAQRRTRVAEAGGLAGSAA